MSAQIGNLNQEQQNRDVVGGSGMIGQAVTGGAAVGGGIIGAKYGAGLGTLVAPGVGTAIGAGVGGAVGAVGGAFSKISLQKRQDVKEAYVVYTTAKSNVDWILNQVNSGQMSASQAVEMYNDELANLYSAEKNLKEELAQILTDFKWWL